MNTIKNIPNGNGLAPEKEMLSDASLNIVYSLLAINNSLVAGVWVFFEMDHNWVQLLLAFISTSLIAIAPLVYMEMNRSRESAISLVSATLVMGPALGFLIYAAIKLATRMLGL